MSNVRFCDQCGVKYPNQAWPRYCHRCDAYRYRNPTPAAVVLQPVGPAGDLLVIKRGVEPQKGEWALPGGYVDYGETWQQGAARELKEETGIVQTPKGMEHFETVSSADGQVLIVFALAPEIAEMPELESNDEVLGVSLISMGDTRSAELAFQPHVDVVLKFWYWHALTQSGT